MPENRRSGDSRLLQWLKQLAALLFGRRPPSPGSSQDPCVGVREPRKRGPGGRQSAVAVMEPQPRQSVRAIGGFCRDVQDR
jgi:hypothetical protein